MIAGLGIDFNPPPSPPVNAASSNPAIARLQGQRGLGKSLPSARDGHLGHARPASDSNAAALIGRRVRIVSAANVYHDADHQSEGEHSYEQEEEEEDLSREEEYSPDGQRKGSSDAGQHGPYAQHIQQSPGQGYDDDDILGDYTNNSQDDEEYGPSADGHEPVAMPQRPSPAPTSHTMQTMQSLGAVSSGSSTRYHDGATMRHAVSLTNLKAEEFEARLRNLQIQDYQPLDPSLYALHAQAHIRSYSVDEYPPPSSIVSTVRGNLPEGSAAPVASAVPRGLRRAPAMSRPRSMMELSQLYAYQSIENAGAVPVVQAEAYHSPAQQSQQHPPASYSSRGQAVDHTSPMSVSTEDGYSTSCSGGHSTAPSSIYGSTEMKPAATFMARQLSNNQSSSQQCPTIPELPHSQQAQAQPRSHQLTKAQSAISMRSQASMRGLERAETGSAAVVLDTLGKGFLAGIPFDPRNASRDLKSPPVVDESEQSKKDLARQIQSRPLSVASSRFAHAQSMSSLIESSAAQTLQRQSTLLSAGANPAKRAKELERLLAPKSAGARQLHSSEAGPFDSAAMPCQPIFSPGGTSFHPVDAIGPQPALKRKASTVVLEQAAKGKARVELDLLLASSLVVEGGMLKGRMEVRVRKDRDGEGEVWLGAVKARIVGFEELVGEEARHVFYHHSGSIDNIAGPEGSSQSLPCYASTPDKEGFCKGKVGAHSFPFNMHIPVGKGAKGSHKSKQGIVKYIVIGSVKLKSHVGTDRSIAHFYRHVDVYPYFNPSIILAPSAKALTVEASKALFMRGSGKVNLSASLHRLTWVAGQRCYVDVRVKNGASKKIKTLNISLIRTTTVFRPRPYLTAGNGVDANDPVHADVDQDACQTLTTKKKVAETTLDMGKKSGRGTVTAKGMWMGVEPGEEVDFCHHLLLPSDALTLERGRYLEVTYTLKIAVSGSLSTEVGVDLPCRVVNFVSIDPPPGHCGPLPIAVPAIASAPKAPAEAKTMSRSFSTDHLRTHSAPAMNAYGPPTQAPTGSAAVTRMTSMDSLNITDLNRMYAMPGMVRGLSEGSKHSGYSASGSSGASFMSRAHTVSGELGSISEAPVEEDSPPLPSQAGAVVERVQARQMRHKMSLDCIGSAIASATARRQGHVRTNSGLSLAYSPQEAESARRPVDTLAGDDRQHYTDQVHRSSYPELLPEPEAVQLDDLDDIPDTVDDLPLLRPRLPFVSGQTSGQEQHPTPASFGDFIQVHDAEYLEYEDESEDEVDLVLQTKQYGSDDETENVAPRTAFGTAVPPASPGIAGARRTAPASPVKSSALRMPTSPVPTDRRSVPASPRVVRASVDPDALRASGDSVASQRMVFGVASPSSPVKKGSAPVVSPPLPARGAAPAHSPVPSSLRVGAGARVGAGSPVEASPRKSSALTSPRPMSTTSVRTSVRTTATSSSVKGRVAALESASPAKKETVQVIRKVPSAATIRRETAASSRVTPA